MGAPWAQGCAHGSAQSEWPRPRRNRPTASLSAGKIPIRVAETTNRVTKMDRFMKGTPKSLQGEVASGVRKSNDAGPVFHASGWEIRASLNCVDWIIYTKPKRQCKAICQKLP